MKNRQKICKSKDLAKGEIEGKIIDYLFDTILSADNIKALKEKLNVELQLQIDTYSADRERYQIEFDDADKSIKNLLKVIKSGLSDDLLLKEYKKEKARYAVAEFNLSSVAPPSKLSDQQIESIIEMAQGKERTDDLLHIIFDQFVERVDIAEDGEIKITSKFRLEPTPTGSTFAWCRRPDSNRHAIADGRF